MENVALAAPLSLTLRQQSCVRIRAYRAARILIPSTRVHLLIFFFFQAEDGIRDLTVTGVQTCALPISGAARGAAHSGPGRLGERRRRLRGTQSAGRRGDHLLPEEAPHLRRLEDRGEIGRASCRERV